MSSIIEGYNYDIFISYRQKDNKGDRWVSNFVEALKTELEAAFKEDISVYFDENPHDRLQETHDVDKSLEGKLKCLIFIPILSQTYCDPNGYAWQHEFLAFLQMVKNDLFGKDVKLRSGNVASRILPIRIHDLEPEDVKSYEKETGSVFRAIDFVFKTATGVSRPLLPNEDHQNDNLNKTYYRDQINKVSHAIKEIILGIKAEPAKVTIGEDQPEETVKVFKEDEKRIDLKQPAKVSKVKFLIPVVIVALLIIAGIIVYPKIFKRDTLEKLRSSGERISIAVMPFKNMTNDTLWNVWQGGIQDMLITSFSDDSEDIIVRQIESVNSLVKNNGITNYASLTPSIAGTLSQKLDANIFICGNIKQAGSALRVYAQLFDTKTNGIIKSFQIEGIAKENNLFHLIDSLSKNIKDYFIITKLKEEVTPDFQNFTNTNSPAAYRYFVLGENARRDQDNHTAARYFLQAVTTDSNFYLAGLRLWSSYRNQGLNEQAKKWCLYVYNRRDKLPLELRLLSEKSYASEFETPYEEIRCLRQLLKIDDQSPTTYYDLGLSYYYLQQYDKAIPMYEKALEIYNKWNTKPYRAANYSMLGVSYHKMGDFVKERQLYIKAEQDFPDDPSLIYQQAVLSLSSGDTAEADRYIRKVRSIWKENSASEANITDGLASTYSEAGLLDIAEDYHRKALSLEPDNPYLLNNLAWFLIDKDRNVEEGLELIEKAREFDIDEYYYVDCKGYGLLKLGKYYEALKFLERSDSLKPIYNHDLFLNLEAAKKAVAEQKNN